MDVNQIKEEYVIRNLFREAKIMSKLNHPCIAALYQTMHKTDNVYYLITELVAGGDLCSFVKDQRNGRLEEKTTKIYARQFASALSHMHELGVVHRDLKMENVMLNYAKTQIKVVDFGLSNVWSTNNPLKTHCGSPEYAAPELFVTGKQYGAEVDLWSLGIILYGMVVGQLPFVANREDCPSSQERRRRLVDQINKGLSIQHRRALSNFSVEFRNLMGRLLIPDSAKRITIKEMVTHPWITDRGKKFIWKHPMKDLEASYHNKVITEVANLLQVSTSLIATTIVQDKYGKVGGIYNILSHQCKLVLLPVDGITRNVSSFSNVNDTTKSELKPNTKLLSSARSASQKKPSTATNVRKTEYCLPNANEAKIVKKVLKNDVNKQRPSTVHERVPVQKTSNVIDYRLLKSPTLRRKAYSAAIAHKTGKPPAEEQIKKVKKVEKNSLPTPNQKKELPPLPSKTAAPQLSKERCKSEHASTRRSCLTSSQAKVKKSQRVERIISTQSASKAVHKPSLAPDLKFMMQRQIFTRRDPWEKSMFAYGDPPVRAVSVPHHQGRECKIYDPIAKCIADYVSNNIQNGIRTMHSYNNK